MRFRPAALLIGIGSILAAACGGPPPGTAEAERALAALAEGELSAAEAAADAAADSGNPFAPAWRDFVRGNTAFARAVLAGRQAGTIEAEPFAWDAAIAFAESARDAWVRAARSRDDWPAARRNVERALLLLDEFRRRKEEADRNRQPPERRPPPPPALPPPGEPPPTPEAEGDPRTAGTELTAEEVRRLIDLLAEKEREKTALRRSEREARGGGVERDW